MRELFILLKYSSKNKQRRKKVSFFGGNIQIFLLQYIIFAIISGFFYYRMLSFFNIEISGINFSFILSGFYIILFSFLFLFNYTPFIAINLYENQFLPFLLTLPVRKIILFFYSSIDTLIYSGFALSFIFPFSIVAPIIFKTNIFLSVIGFLFFALIIISIANISGIVLAYFITKTASKIIGTLSYLLVFFSFYFLSSKEFLSPEKFQNFKHFERLKEILFHPLSPLGWYLNIVNGKYYYLLPIFFLSLILLFFSIKIPINFDFSISRRKEKKNIKYKKSFSILSPFLKKDLNFLRRDASSTYLTLFSIAYPLLLYFTSNNPYSPLFVFAALNSFYCALVSVHLFAHEKRALPLPKTLPVSEKDIIRTKIFIPTIIYFFIYLIISLFMIKKTLYSIFFAPVIFILSIFESVLSIYLLTRKPSRDYSQKMILSQTEFLSLEFFSLFITAICVFLPLLYIQHKKGIFTIDFITKIESIPLLSPIIFLFIPSLLLFLLIYFSFKMFRKLSI